MAAGAPVDAACEELARREASQARDGSAGMGAAG